MQNLALYRKYRPQDFSSVCGQETITRILKNQITTGRIGHAYLFSGIRGTGKTSIAKIFARAVNCENPVDGNPCGECPTCKALSQPSAMDIIEIDAASNRGVDEIRDLRETITYPPTAGKYKVYIIDESHMLTKEAFNALLKTLEEPPEHAIFILATTEPAKLPATILSRCQKYNVKPIADEVLKDRMQEICQEEGVQIEDEALVEITRRAGHSMRDALSLLDQCVDLRLPGELITELDVADFLGVSSLNQIAALAQAQADKNGTEVLAVLEDIRRQGKEDAMLLEDLSSFYKQMLYYKITGKEDPLYGDYFDELAPLFTIEELYKTIDVLLDAHSKLRFNALGQIVTDTALLSLCTDLDSLPVETEHRKRTVKSTRKEKAKPKEKLQQEKRIIEDPAFMDEPVDPAFADIPEAPPVIEEPVYTPPKTSPQEPKREIQEKEEKPAPAPQKQTKENQEYKNTDLALFKKNVIQLAKAAGEPLLAMLFENAEYRMNRHGLFILIEDSHQFMFHTAEFQEKVQQLVNQALGKQIKVYPKLKSKYYERFGKKDSSQSKAASSPRPSSKSLKEQVIDIIGDPNVIYEIVD